MHSPVFQAAAQPVFQPVAQTPCGQVSVCLRSTAQQRLAAGCADDAAWRGRWSFEPTTLAKAGFALANKNSFQPSDPACEVADPLELARRGTQHLTVASAQFIAGRLRGLAGGLLLLLGSSIDNGFVHEACDRFRREVHTRTAAPSRLHPNPGLHLIWCRLPLPLNLTLAEVSLKGLTTLAFQRDASQYAAHLREVHALLAPLPPPDWLVLAGIEWDFKQWSLQHIAVVGEGEWAQVRRSLRLQLEAAARQWPRLSATLLRTQFRTTYRWHRQWSDRNASLYARFSDILRSEARSAAASSSSSTAASSTAQRGGRQACGGVGVLDLARLMQCSAPEHGYGCGALSGGRGWTKDGLHPMQPGGQASWQASWRVRADASGAGCSSCLPADLRSYPFARCPPAGRGSLTSTSRRASTSSPTVARRARRGAPRRQRRRASTRPLRCARLSPSSRRSRRRCSGSSRGRAPGCGAPSAPRARDLWAQTRHTT